MRTFDLDAFVDECLRASKESEPHAAVRELLAEAVAHPEAIRAALGPATQAELHPLFVNDEISVMRVIWAPGMTVEPHDHLIWGAIGVYAGTEENAFFRLDRDDRLQPTVNKTLETHDAMLMGRDTIHAVHNPRGTFTEAIHVYGGNFPKVPGRRTWDADTGVPSPTSVEQTQAVFDRANQNLRGARR